VNLLACICAIDKATLPTLMEYWVRASRWLACTSYWECADHDWRKRTDTDLRGEDLRGEDLRVETCAANG